MCRGRLLVRTCRTKYHKDLDYLVEQLDWAGNVNPRSRTAIISNRSPRPAPPGAGYEDKWIGLRQGRRRGVFTAKELTVQPGVKSRSRTTAPTA